MHTRNTIHLLCCLFIIWGCSKEDDEPIVTEEVPSVTLIISQSGLGDNGYNDLIMTGIMNFYEKNDVSLRLRQPENTNEVKMLIHSWLNDSVPQSTKRLLILADNQYGQLLKEEKIKLGNKQQILLFENDGEGLPQGVNTFRFNRFGAFYLAGCMASPHCSATIIAAMEGDKMLQEAIEGFSEGYEEKSGKKVNQLYLANDASGYAMPDSAYRIAGRITNSFIVPLAGGSNNGIYKYSRETNFYMPLIAGMDVDCSYRSHRVPFSIVININNILEQYLSAWIKDTRMPQHAVYNLKEHSTDVLVNEAFFDNTYLFEDYYLNDIYWAESYQQYYEEAVRKEYEHETN